MDLARKVKRMMSLGAYFDKVDQELVDRWEAAFTKWI